MSLKSNILLTCRNATLLMSKKQEQAISFREKIQMYLHLLICKACALFYKQSNHLHDSIKNLSKEENTTELIQLDEQKKSSMQNLIEDELKK